MAFVVFEVLYNNEGVSALSLQLAGPIVLTWQLRRYSRCSPGAPLYFLPGQNNLFVSALTVVICAITEHSSKGVLHSVTEVNDIILTILTILNWFVLKRATAGNLAPPTTHARQSASFFLSLGRWCEEVCMICVCLSHGVIYYTLVRPNRYSIYLYWSFISGVIKVLHYMITVL